MLALLFAVALIGLTLLALALAGVVAAIATGVVLLNAAATLLCRRSRALRERDAARRERWRPSSFRAPPEPTLEPLDERAHTLTVHRR
jgi:4-hydroxybenzoate polyprenyltransferase